MVHLQHRWLFGSIRHLCDGHTFPQVRNGAGPPVLLELLGPTVDVSGFSFCRLQRVADAIDVLSHDSDDIFTAFNQLWHLQGEGSRCLTAVMKRRCLCSRFSGAHLAGGPGAGGGDRHPQVSVGVSLLNNIVGDGTTTII